MSQSPTQTYHDIDVSQIDSEYIRQKLKVKELTSKDKFTKKHPSAKKYLSDSGVDLAKLRNHSAKIIGASALSGTLFLSSPTSAKALPSPQEVIDKFKEDITSDKDTKPQNILTNNLALVLPDRVRPLDRNEEKFIEQLFENIVGVKTRATLEGEHLNTTYGLIGAEQHLPRYSGDKAMDHDLSYLGITPGRGAWGYFAPSKEELTDDLKEKEKWYAVVQTLYLDDWSTRQPHLKNWYKYRKVLIVNTNNGNAVVAAVADSGPAMWTGKNFGGSPEVMEYLGGTKYKKGPVIIFFVDDPKNEVPLGPVEYDKIKLPDVAYLK